MTELDHTPADPPNVDPNRVSDDPAVDDVPHEPDEGDLGRGDADGSTGTKPALEESLEDAGDIAGVQTHTEKGPAAS